MDITLLLRMAGIGMLVAVCSQVLSKSGRDEQALLLTITGMFIGLMLVMGELAQLIADVRRVFGL